MKYESIKNRERFLIYPGAEAFKKDDPNAEVYLLDAGHFALESQYEFIAEKILQTFA